MENSTPKTVYIVYMHGYDPYPCFYNVEPGAFITFDYVLKDEIEKAGYTLKFSNDASNLQDVAAIISWVLTPELIQNLPKYQKERCILLTFEPPIIAPNFFRPEIKNYFGNIFTTIDDLVDNKTYFKIYVPTHTLDYKPERTSFSDKKLCTLMNSNKTAPHRNELYSERRKAISYFTKTGEFDFYGYGWENVPGWKGTVGNKYNTISKYKFCISFENMKNQRGYISEKIIDCFVGDCIPVYYGASNITDYIPKNCFIDFREFKSYETLYQFMKNMDQKTYESYIEAGRNFLTSPQAQPFSKYYIAQNVMKRVRFANGEVI